MTNNELATARRIASTVTAAGYPARVSCITRRPIVVVTCAFEDSIDLCIVLRHVAGVGIVEPSGAEDSRYRVHLAA